MYLELQILSSLSLVFSSIHFMLMLCSLLLGSLIFSFSMMLFLLNLEMISILLLSVVGSNLFLFLYLMMVVVIEAVFGLSLLLSQIRSFGNDKVMML